MLVVTATGGAQTRNTSTIDDWDGYHNGKYGYVVSYPKLLLPQGEPDAGDGQRFESKDKKFTVAVWGAYNVFEHTVATECAWRIEAEQKDRPFTVTYKVVKSDWYVFSGVAASTIVYQKGILKDDTFKTLYLEYPLSDKDSLNSIVKRIIGSFSST